MVAGQTDGHLFQPFSGGSGPDIWLVKLDGSTGDVIWSYQVRGVIWPVPGNLEGNCRAAAATRFFVKGSGFFFFGGGLSLHRRLLLFIELLEPDRCMLYVAVSVENSGRIFAMGRSPLNPDRVFCYEYSYVVFLGNRKRGDRLACFGLF